MDLDHRRELKAAAAQSLRQCEFSPKKLVLIYAGAQLGLSLLVSLLSYFLDLQADSASGLSGIASYSVLATVQSVLSLAQMLVVPFWAMGYRFAVLQIADGRQARPASLLEGFRRFGPTFRLKLLEGLLYFAVCLVGVYVGTMIFTFTPLAAPLYETIMPYADAAVLDEAALLELEAVLYEAMAECILPIIAIVGGVCLLLLAPIFYRFRMADFCLLDAPGMGALRALGQSARLLKRKKWKLFRLDLSFWWYYLLVVASLAVCYADLFAQELGISLPVDAGVASLLCIALYCLCTLALSWWRENEVSATYAVAYLTLKREAQLPINPNR